MIENERGLRAQMVWEAGKQMMVAARTAPKAKGIDIIEMVLLNGEEAHQLAEEMQKIGHEKEMAFFLRDAGNILQADAVLILGTRHQTMGLNCAHCGYATCTEKPEAVPCALNSIDVGIALGSACAKAADLRVDTRVMFSAGLAAQRLRLLGESFCTMAIPISASAKNPFFDRQPK